MGLWRRVQGGRFRRCQETGNFLRHWRFGHAWWKTVSGKCNGEAHLVLVSWYVLTLACCYILSIQISVLWSATEAEFKINDFIKISLVFCSGYITEVCGRPIWDHFQHSTQRQCAAASHQVHVWLPWRAGWQALYQRLRCPTYLEEQLVRDTLF